jgi:hypothetical protein
MDCCRMQHKATGPQGRLGDQSWKCEPRQRRCRPRACREDLLHAWIEPWVRRIVWLFDRGSYRVKRRECPIVRSVIAAPIGECVTKIGAFRLTARPSGFGSVTSSGQILQIGLATKRKTQVSKRDLGRPVSGSGFGAVHFPGSASSPDAAPPRPTSPGRRRTVQDACRIRVPVPPSSVRRESGVHRPRHRGERQ